MNRGVCSHCGAFVTIAADGTAKRHMDPRDPNPRYGGGSAWVACAGWRTPVRR